MLASLCRRWRVLCDRNVRMSYRFQRHFLRNMRSGILWTVLSSMSCRLCVLRRRYDGYGSMPAASHQERACHMQVREWLVRVERAVHMLTWMDHGVQRDRVCQV